MPAVAAQQAQEQQILLPNISWPTYQAMLADLGDSPIHLTYDRGRLEIMTLSFRHEKIAELIGRLIEAFTEELNIPIVSGGSATCKREDLEKGLEPDQCFYIANEALVRVKEELDLRIDPAPDLAIEVDITHNSVNRMDIYAALGVPEVWQFDGVSLHVYRLKLDGAYESVIHSPTFPFLHIDRFVEFVNKRNEMDQTSLARAFRAWVRKDVLPRFQAGS